MSPPTSLPHCSQHFSCCDSSGVCWLLLCGCLSTLDQTGSFDLLGMHEWHLGLAAAGQCLVPNDSKQSWPDAGWHAKGQGLLPFCLLSSSVSFLESSLGPFHMMSLERRGLVLTCFIQNCDVPQKSLSTLLALLHQVILT